jgi:hypothetical protein
VEQLTADHPQAVHPAPERASEMPYAPAIEVIALLKAGMSSGDVR